MSTRAAATLAVAAVAAVLLTLAPPPAHAQTAPANAGILAADVGYNGQFWPGHQVVVRVRVQPTRLVDGHLLVVGPTGRVRRNVEVAGGSVKEFVFVLATHTFVNDVDVTVELRRGGDVVRKVQARASFDPDVEVVGLLPGAAGNGPVPPPAPLAVDAGVAQFAKLTALELSAAPASLDGLQVIAAAAGELASLGDDAAAAIDAWVAGGGRLLVDEPPGAVVPGLRAHPDLRTDAGGRALVGAGEVVAVNGAVSGARWTGLVEPSARTIREDSGFTGAVNGVVAREANVRQAGLGGLTVFLLLYVLVVGPVLFLVLSRTRRRHLAWIGVPGVALVFTVGAYVVGRDLRSGVRPAHATVLVVQGDQAEARTWVGLVSQRGGTKKINFPRHWTALEDNSFRSGPLAAVEAVEGGDGLTVPLPLGPGEFGVVTGTGPVRLGGSLEVTGFIDASGLATGKVVNRLPFALDRVAVTVGDQATVIPRIEAGAEAEWTTTTDPSQGRAMHPALESWSSSSFGPPNRGMFDPSSPDAALLDSALRMASLSSDGTTVSAMGWTRDYKPPVRAGSGMVGPTLVATIGNLTLPGDGAPGALTTSVAFLRGRVLSDGMGMGGDRGVLMPEGRASLIRLRSLNPALNPAKANLRVTGFAGTVQVWAGGKWVDVDFTNAVRGAGQQDVAQPARRRVMPAPCPPGADCVSQGVVMVPGGGVDWQEVTVPLPKGAMVNGSVYVRVTGQEVAVGNRYEVLPA